MFRKSIDVEKDPRRAHITLKAVTTTTDQGVFEAVISTESVDREKDIVSADGMVVALRKWNRPIPLAWNHSSKAEDIFGSIDPQSAKNVNGEVVVSGQVDLESDVGKEAWRSFKSRTMGFSFGYLILKSTKRKGGGRDITELDVFEVTGTPTPMNNDTRVLSTKTAVKQLASVTRELLDAAGKERFGGAKDTYVYVDDFDPDGDWVVYCISSDTGESRYVKTTYAIATDLTVTLGTDEAEVTRTTSYQPKSGDPLRKEADRVAREVEATSLPDVPAIEPDPKVDLEHELQEVKTRLAASEKALEDLTKKAEVADKEPRARSADPLRQQAEAVALEVASGGQSLRKPPKTVEAKRAEPSIPLDELKQRCRDEMLGVLSGGLNESL